MILTGSTGVVAVIGDPVRHSLSPALHNAAFAAAGLDLVLVVFEVSAERGRDAIAAMRALGLRGMSVTMPHKVTAAHAVDELDPSAAALESVNTIVLRDDGTTFGTSTDGQGFVDSLTHSGVAVDGRRVAVLGAGGAARSIIDALGRNGVADIAVVNRSAGRAASAVELSDVARVGTDADVRAADLVVNATSVGMAGSGGLPCDPALLRADQTVADIVYHPLETPLLAAARAVGAATVDGLGMLVHQAVHQQVAWTGRRPDHRVMRAAAEAELAARHG